MPVEGNQSGGCTDNLTLTVPMYMILFMKTTIEDAQEKFIDIKLLIPSIHETGKRGMVNDIFFKILKLQKALSSIHYTWLEMKNEVCRPHGFYFDNVVIHGEKVMSPGELHMVGGIVR